MRLYFDTPWEMRRIGRSDDGPNAEDIFSITTASEYEIVARGVKATHAKKLVRAVNSHADLVAALWLMLDSAFASESIRIKAANRAREVLIEAKGDNP